MTTTTKASKVELLKTQLLSSRAITDAERTLQVSAASAKPAAQAELDALRARWESESDARALRAELKARGFRQSDYDHAGCPAWQVWVRKNKITGKWDKFLPDQVLGASGIEI